MKNDQHVWIFLRGLSREKDHWGDFPDLFARQLNTRVVCIDMPGVGEHYQQKASTDIRVWVDHLETQLKRKAPDAASISVFAYSMGAMVANQWVQHTAFDVQRMVWINSSFANLSSFYQRMQWPVIRSLPKFFLHFSDVQKRENWVLRWTTSTPQAYEAQLLDWIDVQNKRPVSFMNFFRHTRLASALKLTQVPKCPMLILQSLQDELVNPVCSQAITDKLQCALASHPKSGHDVVLEDPAWVLQRVSQFIASTAKT